MVWWNKKPCGEGGVKQDFRLVKGFFPLCRSCLSGHFSHFLQYSTAGQSYPYSRWLWKWHIPWFVCIGLFVFFSKTFHSRNSMCNSVIHFPRFWQAPIFFSLFNSLIFISWGAADVTRSVQLGGDWGETSVRSSTPSQGEMEGQVPILSLWWPVTGLKLSQGRFRFRLDIKKKVFIQHVAGQWNTQGNDHRTKPDRVQVLIQCSQGTWCDSCHVQGPHVLVLCRARS